MKFDWIEEHADRFEVQVMCDVLAVSKSGYYARQQRPASPLRQRRQELLEQIRQAHRLSRGTYGSPRITRELKARGVGVCENTVARYMREEGVASKIKCHRFRVRTTDSDHGHPIADNVLDRSFAAEARPTASGPPTSPTSTPTRGGCTWRR